MSVANDQGLKKPDNIIWIEEVLLNNLEENGELNNLNRNEERDRDRMLANIDSNKLMLNKKSGISKGSHNSISTRSSQFKIGIAEIELKDENYLGDERVQTLSRIVTGKIKYYIENKENEEERFQYWFIKLPNLNHPQRELSQMIDAAKREISFYTEILPDIKAWLESHSKLIEYQVDFRVPTCFYGKYLRPVDPDPDLDIITHILDSESLLVLDDLRAVGFGKRHFGTGLLISEAFAAVEEIATFHVTTWAMQEIDNKKLSWPHLYDYQKIAKLYDTLIENNYPTLQTFFTKDSKHPRAREVFNKFQKLRPLIHSKLLSLLAPAEYPSPNTLIHMDLWSDNILFRMSEQDREDETPVEEADLDCFILDWQMVSYGRPTHDLACLIMLSMDPAYRRKYTNVILQYYYLLFQKYAGNFGLSQIPFDYALFKKEFKKSCVLATLMAMASIDIALMEDTTQNRLVEALLDLIEEKLI